MYKILTINDKVRVPPSKFELSAKDAIKSSLEDKLEGIIDRKLGVVLAVIDVGDVGEGIIIHGDGAIHYPVDFEILVYKPEQNELVNGQVIDVTEFGVFIRIGPVDGMVHVSQTMDDFVSFDPKNNVFMGRDSKRILKKDDIVKARIISISMGKEYKIGLTMRQPGLGVLDWIVKDKKAKKKGVSTKAAPKTKKKKK